MWGDQDLCALRGFSPAVKIGAESLSGPAASGARLQDPVSEDLEGGEGRPIFKMTNAV